MKNIIYTALRLSLTLFICICVISGCRNPKVLRNRGYIPDPFPEPAQPASKSPVKTFIEEKTIIEERVVEDTPIEMEAPAKPEPVIPPFPKIDYTPIKHKVMKSESFWTIARKYKVSMKELMAYNKYTAKSKLKAGTILTIPPGGIAPDKTTTTPKKKQPMLKKITIKRTRKRITKSLVAGSGKHIVKSGESLWSISKLYKINNYIALAELNNLDIKKPLYKGQVLVLPKGVTGNIATQRTKKEATPVKPKAPIANSVASPEINETTSIKEDEKITEEVNQSPPATDAAKPSDGISLEDRTLLESIDKESSNSSKKDDAETSKLLETITKDDDFPGEDESLDDEVNELLKGSDKKENSSESLGEHEVVRNGETLEDIAALYGASVKVLIELNPKYSSKTKLKEGTVIKIP